MLGWLEATGPARAVGESLWLTAWLSAAHLIGFTLVMGGAVVLALRLAGALLVRVDGGVLWVPASRLVALGLAISLGTGLLLFAPRASAAADSGAFRLKMLLLLAAATFHFAVARRVAQRLEGGAVARIAGVTGLVLWLGLAVAACWFILFE